MIRLIIECVTLICLQQTPSGRFDRNACWHLSRRQHLKPTNTVPIECMHEGNYHMYKQSHRVPGGRGAGRPCAAAGSLLRMVLFSSLMRAHARVWRERVIVYLCMQLCLHMCPICAPQTHRERPFPHIHAYIHT